MWIMLNDAFFSIVKKDCARDELLVRARRRGDIEKVWPSAVVTEYNRSDYLFRAKIKAKDVVEALDGEVRRITYDNFKNSVQDEDLHDAYMRVWTAMAEVQESPPYGGLLASAFPATHDARGRPYGFIRTKSQRQKRRGK